MQEKTHFFLVKDSFSAEFSLFSLFENSTVPTGKKSTLYNPSVFLQALIVVRCLIKLRVIGFICYDV